MELQLPRGFGKDVNHDPEHDWRLWRVGGAVDAGPAALVFPAADVRQCRGVAGSSPGAIQGNADGTGRRRDAGRGSAAPIGIRRIVDRTPAVATAVRTSD